MIGKNLTGWFEKNSIKYAEIVGNTEIVYYLWEEKKAKQNDSSHADSNDTLNKNITDRTKKLLGVNIGKARQLNLYFSKGEINKMTALDNPSFYMDDEEKLSLEIKRLKGFVWKIEDKPLKPTDVFIKRKI